MSQLVQDHRTKRHEVDVNVRPEEAMLATERYGQAAHDEMGLLHLKIALKLVRIDHNSAKRFAVQSRNFISELQRSKKNNHRRNLLTLDSLMSNIIKGEYGRVNVDEGMKIVEQIASEKRPVLTEAQNGYDRIFKRY